MDRDELDRRLLQALDRNEAAFDRNTAAFDRMIERFDRDETAFDRMIERLNRDETAFAVTSRAIRQMMRTLERNTAAFESRMEQQGRRLDDLGDDLRAHTRAVLALADRLENGGGATA